MKQLLKKLTHRKRRTGAAPSALAFPDAAAAENYLRKLLHRSPQGRYRPTTV